MENGTFIDAGACAGVTVSETEQVTLRFLYVAATAFVPRSGGMCSRLYM